MLQTNKEVNYVDNKYMPIQMNFRKITIIIAKIKAPFVVSYDS